MLGSKQAVKKTKMSLLPLISFQENATVDRFLSGEVTVGFVGQSV